MNYLITFYILFPCFVKIVFYVPFLSCFISKRFFSFCFFATLNMHVATIEIIAMQNKHVSRKEIK